MNEIKVRACNVNHLKRQIRGRKDCIIFIPYSCLKEINEINEIDYFELQEDLQIRNIKLQVEEK